MERKTEHIVRLRAGGLCEYCRLPQSISFLTFPLDHVIAIQHGGQGTEENLAVACPECNLSKGPNVAGLDPRTGKLTRLFNPRIDEWTRHFRFEGGDHWRFCDWPNDRLRARHEPRDAGGSARGTDGRGDI